MHRMQFESSYAKISANSGLDQGCLSLRVTLQRPLIQLYDLCWRTSDGCSMMAPNSSPTSMTGTFGSSRIAALKLISAATRSINLELQPSKIQVWIASCPDPVPPDLLEKVKLKVKLELNCLGGHLHIQDDGEPSPDVLGEHATMEEAIRRFRDISATLAELIAEGLDAQTVNDLLTMYVGAASQHVLRMSFVPEDEAKRFDTEVIGFWSHLVKRGATSPSSTCNSSLAAWALLLPGELGKQSSLHS